MDAEAEDNPQLGVAAGEDAVTPVRDNGSFFQKTDWRSFWLTVAFTLIVYLYTVASNVSFGDSAIFSTGAMYAGVPDPNGHPTWTLYAWLFTKVIPFSNIAWRIGVSSAVAASLACGCVALMVSRAGEMVIGGLAPVLTPKDAARLRVVCGAVAGAGFGFSGAFWRNVTRADTWPLEILLFSLETIWLMRWMFCPTATKYLFLASLAYGLLLVNRPEFLVLAPAFCGVMLLGNARLGRTLFVAITLLIVLRHGGQHIGWLSPAAYVFDHFGPGRWIAWWIEGIMVATSLLFCIFARGILVGWKATLAIVAAFLLGYAVWLYVPIASMTNPPVNWGYARSIDGHRHFLSRGCYCVSSLETDFSKSGDQASLYCRVTLADFGWLNCLFGGGGLGVGIQNGRSLA